MHSLKKIEICHLLTNFQKPVLPTCTYFCLINGILTALEADTAAKGTSLSKNGEALWKNKKMSLINLLAYQLKVKIIKW